MEFQVPSFNLLLILPVIIVFSAGTLLMFFELIVPAGDGRTALRIPLIGRLLSLLQRIFRAAAREGHWIALIGLAAALLQTVGLWNYEGGAFAPVGGNPMLLLDNFASFLNLTFLLTGLVTVLISVNYLRRTGLERTEFYMLLLFSISGMMLMGMANDLILIFLALELLSIPLYIMSALAWPRPESEESAMKYFLLGAFSSSILVFGVALTYGAAGSTSLPAVLANIGDSGVLGMAGIAFLIVGFAFKVAAVPFHMWTPDVYQGAPTAVTAFMSVGAKVGGFAALLRILVGALPGLGDTWMGALAAISALTLVLGNVVAIVQPNIKRMLAYSSIAHAGYILIAVAASANSDDGVGAALFYMLAYLFTNLGAFAVVIAVERRENQGVMLDDYKGLAKRSPLFALAMAYFMLSLTGVPPTGGFSGKFYVFRAAIEADLLWLAIVGVVTSVVSGYYYLRVVYLMYMHEGDGEVAHRWPLATAVGLTAAVTLLLGILPGAWFDLARDAVIGTAQLVAAGG